jgi:hypothetical protein
MCNRNQYFKNQKIEKCDLPRRDTTEAGLSMAEREIPNFMIPEFFLIAKPHFVG